MEIKVKVIELRPGWLFVWFQTLPPVEEREFWLRQTLSDWLSEHPHSIQRMLPVEHEGELLGVHVWLGEPTDVPAVKLHPALASVPKEHLEALLVEHAQQIYSENLGVAGVVVVSRGGTAVVFSHNRGYALPFTEFARDLEEKDRRDVEEWLARPNSNYFVLYLSSGWVPHG